MCEDTFIFRCWLWNSFSLLICFKILHGFYSVYVQRNAMKFNPEKSIWNAILMNFCNHFVRSMLINFEYVREFPTFNNFQTQWTLVITHTHTRTRMILSMYKVTLCLTSFNFFAFDSQAYSPSCVQSATHIQLSFNKCTFQVTRVESIVSLHHYNRFQGICMFWQQSNTQKTLS